MTRIKKNTFFSIHNLEYNEDILDKYNNGWTLSEIKEGKEYIRYNYEKEVKMFKKNELI